MNAAFIVPLKHAGLALAIGLGACLNATLLFRKLRQHGIYQPQAGWWKFLAKLAAALAAMALVLWSAKGPERWWLAAPGMTKAMAVTGLVLLGGATYFACLWLLGIRPREFARRAA